MSLSPRWQVLSHGVYRSPASMMLSGSSGARAGRGVRDDRRRRQLRPDLLRPGRGGGSHLGRRGCLRHLRRVPDGAPRCSRIGCAQPTTTSINSMAVGASPWLLGTPSARRAGGRGFVRTTWPPSGVRLTATHAQARSSQTRPHHLRGARPGGAAHLRRTARGRPLCPDGAQGFGGGRAQHPSHPSTAASSARGLARGAGAAAITCSPCGSSRATSRRGVGWWGDGDM